MAFISMVFVLIFLAILFLGLCGLILLIIGIVKKAKNKKMGRKSRGSKVLIVFGSVLLFPIIAILIVGSVSTVHSNMKNRGLIGYQVKEGTVEGVERLLKKGVSPDCVRDTTDENVAATDGEYTLLCYLCYSDEVPEYAEKMQLLIDYGADVNWQMHWCEFEPEEHISIKYDQEIGYNDSCGETPLMMASGAGNVEAVKVLLENGADVNAQDYCQDSALIYASKPNGYSSGEDSQVEIVKLLLEYGADKDVRGIYSGTALENAEQYNMWEVVKLLSE